MPLPLPSTAHQNTRETPSNGCETLTNGFKTPAKRVQKIAKNYGRAKSGVFCFIVKQFLRR